MLFSHFSLFEMNSLVRCLLFIPWGGGHSKERKWRWLFFTNIFYCSLWVLLLKKNIFQKVYMYKMNSWPSFFSCSRSLKVCRLSFMRVRKCVNFANFWKYGYLCMHACVCVFPLSLPSQKVMCQHFDLL